MKLERVGIWRQRLVFRVEGPAPIDDLTDLAIRLVEHLLNHQVVVDDRHAPDDRFERAPLYISAR